MVVVVVWGPVVVVVVGVVVVGVVSACVVVVTIVWTWDASAWVSADATVVAALLTAC